MSARKLSVLLALPCALLFLGSCRATKEAQKQHYYQEGMDRYAKAQYKEASLAFRKAIQKDPEFGEAYYRLGLAELHPDGDLPRAVTALRRATVLLPYKEEPKIKLAEIYLQSYIASSGTEKYPIDQARGLAQVLLQRNPKSYQGLRLSGHVAALEQRHQEAIDLFHKADAIKPGQNEVLFPLALELAFSKQPEASQKLLLELLAKDKTYFPVYESLYTQYAEAGRIADAEAIANTWSANLPNDSAAVLLLARHYFRHEKSAQMEAALARLTSDPKRFPQGLLQAGDFYRSIGKLPEARERYQAGLRLNSSDRLQYQKRLATLLVLDGKRDEAAQAYGSIIKELPKDEESRETQAALLLEKDVDGAVKELQALVKENPNNPQLRYNLGQAYLAKRDLPQARLCFLEASRRRKAFLLPRIALAQMAVEANQFKELDQWADEILALNPNSPEGKFFRCTSMTGLGQYADARRELNKLLKEFPQYSDAKLQLSFVDLAEKKYGDAEAALQKLYAASHDVRALNGLVDVYLTQKQNDRAYKLATDEVKKNPSSQRIRLLAGETAMRIENYPAAIDHFLQLAAVDPNWDYLYILIGRCYQASDDLGRAALSFRKARDLSPKNVEATLRLGFVLELAGKYKDAIAAYRDVLAINPDVPIAMNNIAYLLAETGGDLDEALRLAQGALQRIPQQSYISDTIGWVMLKRNQPDAAMQIFSTLVRKYPDEPVFHYHMAATFLQKGDRSHARAEAQVALLQKPTPDQERKLRALMARMQ